MDFQQFIRVLSHSDDTDGLFDNGELVDLITLRNECGRTSGHEIAWKNDAQTLENFFCEVVYYELSTLPEVLDCADNSNRKIGHYIAEFKGFQSLKYFFELVLSKAPEKLNTILNSSIVDGWMMAHLVARYQCSDAFTYFIDFIFQHAPEHFSTLLKSEIDTQWNFLLVTARYQKPQQLKYLLDKILEHTPHLIPHLVNYHRCDGLHLAHSIAEFQDDELLEYYFDKLLCRLPGKQQVALLTANYTKDSGSYHLGFSIVEFRNPKLLQKYFANIITNSPDSLAELLQQKNADNEDLIDVIVNSSTHSIGAVAFQLISANRPLGAKIHTQLKQYRIEVLDYISTLPAEEQLQVLPQLTVTHNPLGAYFNLKKDFLHRHFGDNHELLSRIKEMLKLASMQQRASETEHCSSVKLELFAGLPVEYRKC